MIKLASKVCRNITPWEEYQVKVQEKSMIKLVGEFIYFYKRVALDCYCFINTASKYRYACLTNYFRIPIAFRQHVFPWIKKKSNKSKFIISLLGISHLCIVRKPHLFHFRKSFTYRPQCRFSITLKHMNKPTSGK